MRFSIRAIGKIKEKWMREGIEEYSKRLKPVAKVDVLESDEEKMPENPSAAIKRKGAGKRGRKASEINSRLRLCGATGHEWEESFF